MHSNHIQTELEDLHQLSPEDALHKFSDLLCQEQAPWPFEELLHCYQSIWRRLPELIRDGKVPSCNPAIDHVYRRIKQIAPPMLKLIPCDSAQPAFIDPNSGREISYWRISEFVATFDLGLKCPPGGKPRVVTILPNGPLSALAALAIANRYTFIPLANTMTLAQLSKDIRSVNADAVLILHDDALKSQLDPALAIFTVRCRADLTFSVSRVSQLDQANQVNYPATTNTADDVAMILSTSGTTGDKKLVPITLFNLLCSAIFTRDSLGLTHTSRSLNVMPLHHIGGLTRSLWATILAGGTVICCESFNPSVFWDAVQRWQPTWYYATPTMHHTILAEAEQHNLDAVRESPISFVCNAGGGLAPTLAARLQSVLGCKVLPSYGMTECAPIAAPPLDYSLERTGSSGISTGPDLAIWDINDPMKRSAAGTVGRISVRGLPVFMGYLTPQGIDRSGFNSLGWFDTGDLGYIDDAGYLYITGRRKEVINRGGEIISPLEVEDAIISAAQDPLSGLFGRIAEVLAFSMPHEVFQEVVGVMIVTPPDKKRPDLREIHRDMKPLLDQPKWPALLVYMDQLPRVGSKVSRVQVSDRLGLPALTEHTPIAECHYERRPLPSTTTPLATPIELQRCAITPDTVKALITRIVGTSEVLVRVNSLDGFLRVILFQEACTNDIGSVDAFLAQLRALLHGYLVPTSVTVIEGPVPMDPRGDIDDAAVDAAVRAMDRTMSPLERRICNLFAQILECPIYNMTLRTDFFTSGGDSMTAGRLVSRLRQEFHIHLPAETIFRHSTVGEIGQVVRSTTAQSRTEGTSSPARGGFPGSGKTYSSTNPVVLILNLLPIAVFYPCLLALHWVLFIYLMSESTLRWPFRGGLFGRWLRIISIGLATRLVMDVCTPLMGIAFKWIVIGRYSAGVYAMWGPYHMRWWLTQKAIQVSGKGIFDSFYWTRVLYYRALGARIGRNVRIHEGASLGEYDLIHISDDVTLERCLCRPFAVEHNTSMALQPIRIGARCTVGIMAIVAPGASLAPGTCLGPNSSSWEADDADESNRDLASAQIPKLHAVWDALLVNPLQLIIRLVSQLPELLGIMLVLQQQRDANPVEDPFTRQLLWFADRTRVSGYILIKMYGAVTGPLTWFLAIYLVKRAIDLTCGRPQPGPHGKNSSQGQKVRSAVLSGIFPRGDLSPIARIIGPHYELYSKLVRLLGARVGERVYWPHGGLMMVEDYDLLEVGNDVVFGSRSHIVTADGIGREPVVIGDGAFVGDRVVALPGVTIGKRTTVGSGALLRRGGDYADDTAWAGSKRGDAMQFPRLRGRHADREKVSDGDSVDDTITPFGKAFYEGQADYHVLGMWAIVAYSILIAALVAILPIAGVISGLRVVAHLIQTEHPFLSMRPGRCLAIYGVFTSVVGVVTVLAAILALALAIVAKWMLLGRRREGYYPWHRSSYCQRWQILVTIEGPMIYDWPDQIGVLKFLTGTAYLPIFYRAMGATIGSDCALAANGDPYMSFTEPDLVTLGDRVAVDDASLVCHLNTRGEFEMNPLRVGDRSVLRAGSRLLSGASMGSDACVLEHTLVLSGDHVDDGCTVQGWPSEHFAGNRVSPILG